MTRRDEPLQTLVVISCGSKKIWITGAVAKAQPARNAYIGPLFGVNKEYAEKFSDRWFILSAKYGFLDPDEFIENYEVTFKDPKTNPISIHALQRQVQERGLASCERVVVLGGKEYVDRVKEAFAGLNVTVAVPLLGKRIGEMMSAVRKAIEENEPF